MRQTAGKVKLKAGVAPREAGAGGASQRMMERVAILAAGALAYCNSFAGEFIVDDHLAIVTNGRLRQLWPLTEFLKDTRPVTDYTFALNYAVGGLERSGYHAVNLLIHLAAAMVLHGLVRRTLLLACLSDRYRNSASGIATITALIWVVHPLCTQAVTYIVQRSESLMSLFYLLTLYCLLRSATGVHRKTWAVVCAICCLLGMGSKAVMVTAPVTALLFDAIFLSRSIGGALRSRWPLYVALCTSIGLLWQVGVIGGLYLQSEGETVTVGFGIEGLTSIRYAMTQCGVILHYLRLCFWPHPLVIDYAWPVAKTIGEVLPGLLVILGLFAWTVWSFWRRRAYGFLGAVFLIVLAPTSSFVPIRDIAFEHRMYLPLVSVTVAVVLWVHRWATATSARESHHGRALASRVGVVAIVVVFGALTYQRNGQYADAVALWESNVAQTPNHPRPINALGYAYYKRGRFDEASRMYARAIELDPYYAGAYANRGILAYAQRRFEEGIAQCFKAIEISPHEFGADFYCLYGSGLLEVGRVEEAIAALETAVAGDPGYLDAQYNLGNAYMAKGLLEDAVRSYQGVVKSFPGYAGAYVNMGLCLVRLGRVNEATAAFRNGIEAAGVVNLDAALKARYHLGQLLLEQGKPAEAAAELEVALRLSPAHEGVKAALQRARGG